ncbi:hypothetical protein [Sphingobium sp. Z007]|uniref:hypothetical protein n=1 Tax=Sphingobium sp. Z007 TaxID=627495 RepID=UPI000B49DD9E|nr:hypothetical protein [Sphingobium sp. Z007]
MLELKVPGPVSRAALQAYVDGARPPLADEEEIDTIVARLAIALPRKRDQPGVDGAKLDIYASALSDVPLIDLRAASDWIINNAGFFPSVAEIRKAAAKVAGPRTARIARAELMILRHDRDWTQPVAEGEVVDMGAIMSEALAAHPSKR